MKEFLGFNKDDIVTLSDIQTQTDFSEMSADFRIIETRIYREPNNFFVYTGYVINYQPPEEDPIKMLILIRQVGDASDVMVYFLDNDGAASDFESLFTEDKQDLVNRFDVTMHLKDKESDVTWDKKNDQSTFGVITGSSETGPDQKTLAEYITNDDTEGNSHAFVEWTGSVEKGWIEIWYGCEARKEDIEFFHTKNS